MKKAHALKVAQVVPQGSDAILLNFVLEDEQAPLFRFQPGQYLTLAANVDDQDHWRCYSIVSDPLAGQSIGVLVRRVAGGLVSNRICDQVQPGATLEVLPPAGRFTLAHPGQPLLLFAGGSGIAPIFALARQALELGAPNVTLFYANRNAATAMMLAELGALQEHARGRLTIRYWYDDQDGLPTQDDLSSQGLGFGDSDVYVCGPDPFMKAVDASLKQAGFDAARVHREDFGAAVDDSGGSEEAGAETSLIVTFKGQQHTIAVKRQESLLSAMLNAGLGVPHACKVGECASCICRLEQGEVERLENSVLDEDDVVDGLLVACRTRVASELVRIRFS